MPRKDIFDSGQDKCLSAAYRQAVRNGAYDRNEAIITIKALSNVYYYTFSLAEIQARLKLLGQMFQTLEVRAEAFTQALACADIQPETQNLTDQQASELIDLFRLVGDALLKFHALLLEDINFGLIKEERQAREKLFQVFAGSRTLKEAIHPVTACCDRFIDNPFYVLRSMFNLFSGSNNPLPANSSESAKPSLVSNKLTQKNA